MAFVVFWVTFALLGYAFIGYPLLLKIAAVLSGQRSNYDERYTLTVSLILSVFNEEAVIAEKIGNFQSLDYPSDHLEFVIISDGCEDKTEEIVRSYSNIDPRIRLFGQEQRGGKTLALNRGVAESQGDVLLFTDANSMFDKDAIRKLIRHFADPGIGLVSGRSVYLDAVGRGERSGGAYRSYEETIKEGESRIGSIIGADGAIYALRREIYEPLQPCFINDFLHTLQAVLKGYRAISDSEAICREVVDENYEGEFRRQTRIMAQSWLIFVTQIGPLVRRGGLVYVWEFVSHKLLRWLTLPLVLVLLIANLSLLSTGAFYGVFLGIQGCVALLALAGATGRGGGIGRAAHLFVVLHAAALLGLWRMLRGEMFVTWNPRSN